MQWLIEDQDSDDTRFHTLYAVSLARSALEIIDLDYSNENNDARNHDEMVLVSDVENANNYRYSVRERLQLFLQASDLYDPEEVLDVIEGSELWLEKVITYYPSWHNLVLEQLFTSLILHIHQGSRYQYRDPYWQLTGMI